MQTFMKPQNDSLTMKRAEYTARFINEYINKSARTVLDIGENNPVGNYIADIFNLNLTNTCGDLDYNFIAKDKYDIIFCFEVIEHLMSPKFFLIELKKYLHGGSQIFISWPSRPKALWTNQHFHEYDLKRFRYLIKNCGYEIIDMKIKKYKRKNYFKGLRTPLRLFLNFNILAYLRNKNSLHEYLNEK